MATSVIIDTDPGIDDAIALAMVLFDPTVDVKLITAVGGNVPVDKTSANICKLLDFWNLDIPVAIGADRPIVREPVSAKSVHGESGMDGYDFPEPSRRQVTQNNAVEQMHQVLNQNPDKTTLIAIGPLTNLALLFSVYPQDKQQVEQIILMGGALGRGNFGVLSEFNAAADPEASRIVYHSGLPITVLPVDVGWKALVYPQDSARIKEMGRTGDMLYQLLQHYRGRGLREGLKMYDGCAMAYLLKPELFTLEQTYADVELAGSMTAGATLFDFRGYLGEHEPNVSVATDIDASAFTELLFNQLAKCD